MMRQSPMVGLTLLLLAGSVGCTGSEYKLVGPPEFNVKIQFKRERTISPGESVTTYTVTALTINGHPIELAQSVSSSESRFEVETERYGTIQFRVEGSGGTSYLSLHLTKEQQESIRALGPPAGQIGAPDPPAGEIRSIAVLPLKNLSGDPEQEPFADGMTETLISGLADIGAFDKVAPFTSVMTLKGSDDLSKIARDLSVDVVLVGSVRRTESRVRLAVQLIYVPTNIHVWAEAYDRDLEGLSDVVRDVATKVSNIASGRVRRRVARLLERRGLDSQVDPEHIDTLQQRQPLLAELYGASISGRVATGSRAGRRVAKAGDAIDLEDPGISADFRCAAVSGFSVHAGVSIPAHDRMRLERLCQYCASPELRPH